MVQQADGTVDIDAGFVAESTAPVITWTTRRRMAYICLWSFVGVTIALLIAVLAFNVPDKRLEMLVEIYSYFAIGCMSVVLGYFGFTTLPFIGKGRRAHE